NLNLVVTVDTAAAHLAGALGVPVWVALSTAPHWHWVLGRDSSPWYRTMRLFRQATFGDWAGVFARMADVLRRRPAAPPPARAVTVEVAPGELIDKITILKIKAQRITAPAKLRNVHAELAALASARDRALPASGELTQLTGELKAVNEALWHVEDDLRLC